MKIFIFATDASGAEQLRVVLAENRTEAENTILSDKEEPLRPHLKEQMRKDGIYSHCQTTLQALREYFPVVTEKDLVPGTVFGVRGGSTIFLSR